MGALITLRRAFILAPLALAALATAALTGAGGGGEEPGVGTVRSDAAVRGAMVVSTKLQQVVNRNTVAAPAAAFLAALTDRQQIGIVEIPRIGMMGYIVEGVSEASLRLGSGHIESTPLPGMGGNFTIAGDRVLYAAPFLRANELGPGDEVIVRLPYGIFHYQVESVTHTQPDDISVMDFRGYETVTIITCDPPWSLSGRLTVSARLTAAFPVTA